MRPRAGQRPPELNPSRLLLFAAAGVPLAVPIADLLRVASDQPLVPAPLGHPALSGLLGTPDAAAPVYDLTVVWQMKNPRSPVRPGQDAPLVLLMPHEAGPVGVRVDRLGGLAQQVLPLADQTEARMLDTLPPAARDMVTGAATAQGQLFFFFSKDAFVGWLDAEMVSLHQRA